MNGVSWSESWRAIRPPCAHDNMMLRFRPIAPKPATCPVGAPESSVFTSRRKRKYVRVRKNSRYARRANKRAVNDGVSVETPEKNDKRGSLSLLQLLPERSSDLNRPIEPDVGGPDRTVVVIVVQGLSTAEEARDDRRDVESWVMCLDRDTCPGFVSDGSDVVTWMNEAFRKMVSSKEEDQSVVVGLVIKERFPSFYSALTGHVKLQYYNCHAPERKPYSRVLPCDLWSIDGGGFAWRLDVDAALTLGRT